MKSVIKITMLLAFLSLIVCETVEFSSKKSYIKFKISKN
jgi:hypothetical protein